MRADSFTVKLDEDEQIQAANVAYMRSKRHKQRGTPHRYGLKAKDVDRVKEIGGVAAEMAVSKAFGFYWTGLEKVGARDCGLFEVRSTPGSNNHLLLHPTDPDGVDFIFVVCDMPVFHLVGWIRGAAAKDPKYYGDPKKTRRPCYWIPQRDLRSIYDLRDLAVPGVGLLNPIENCDNVLGEEFRSVEPIY